MHGEWLAPQVCMQACKQARKHARTHAHTHARTSTCTHIRMHTHEHACTNVHTHIHLGCAAAHEHALSLCSCVPRMVGRGGGTTATQAHSTGTCSPVHVVWFAPVLSLCTRLLVTLAAVFRAGRGTASTHTHFTGSCAFGFFPVLSLCTRLLVTLTALFALCAGTLAERSCALRLPCWGSFTTAWTRPSLQKSTPCSQVC